MRYLLAACAIAWGGAAFANPQCGDREEISEALRGQFGEQQRFIGIDAGGNLLEMYVSPGGSFTAILTQPGGPTCIVVTGESGNILPSGDMG